MKHSRDQREALNRSWRTARRVWTVIAATGWLCASTLAAQAGGEGASTRVTRADYESMLEGLYSGPVAVPAGGLTLTRDVGTWTLSSGQVRLLAPVSTGRTTGLVFEGQGRFEMAVPDPVERAQLARMAENDGMTGVDVAFSTLVLRTSGTAIDDWFAQAPSRFDDRDKTAADRQRHWLEQRFDDVDARVLCGLLTPDDAYLRVDVDSDEFGWLTFDFDGMRREEVRLSRFDSTNRFMEHWVSLDRAEDRDGEGRPTSDYRPLFDLVHVEVAVDLREASKKTSRVGFMNILPRQGQYDVTVTIEPLVDGPTVLYLGLGATANVAAVYEGETVLPFVRDHVGSRSSSMDNQLFDNQMVVLLEAPLRRGERRDIRVVYERETLNYLPGGSWYPRVRKPRFATYTRRTSPSPRAKNTTFEPWGR